MVVTYQWASLLCISQSQRKRVAVPIESIMHSPCRTTHASSSTGFVAYRAGLSLESINQTNFQFHHFNIQTATGGVKAKTAWIYHQMDYKLYDNQMKSINCLWPIWMTDWYLSLFSVSQGMSHTVRVKDSDAPPPPPPPIYTAFQPSIWSRGRRLDGAEGHRQGLQTDIRPKPELKSY